MSRLQMQDETPTLGRRTAGFRTKAEIAYDAIREAMQGESLDGGDRLAAADLAEQLGMSPVPVREALNKLAAQGLVRVDAHRGYFVPKLSSADLLDIYETLAALEPLAARLAVPRLTKAELDTTERILAELVALESSPAAWIVCNLKFHMSIYVPAERPRLLRTIEQLGAEAMRELQRHETYLNFLTRSDKEHRQLVALARKRRVDELAALLERHIRATCAELVMQKRKEEEEAEAEAEAEARHLLDVSQGEER